jgi:hypothetical protein
MRELFVQAVQLKLSLYRSASKPPSQSPAKSTVALCELSDDEQAKKAEFLRSFLVASVLPLWPEGWMQLSVLMGMAQSKAATSTTANISSASQHQKSQQQYQKSQMNASLNMPGPPNTAATSSPLARNNMSLNEASLPTKQITGLNLVSKSGKLSSEQ